MKGSIVIPCLNSHEVVRRQILWFDSWMKPFSSRWNLVIVDDGSNPAISIISPTNFNTIVIHISPHEMKWTHPKARNMGAKSCPNSEFLFFVDVDHIITPEALTSADSFNGNMMRVPRRTGALDENGKLLTNDEDLLRFGAAQSELGPVHKVAATTCLIRKTTQDAIGGFNEKFCGRYGHEDGDYRRRYGKHVIAGKCKPLEICPASIYVFPNPNANRQGLFHSLSRKKIP